MLITKQIRKSRWLKIFSLSTAWIFLFQSFFPTAVMAISQSPGHVSTGYSGVYQKMVDPFTGDFKYSIPLLNVNGRPLSLNYDANINANQDASWVGLGWSLNPGNIKRNLRGIPDDFNANSDKIENTEKIKDRVTSGKSNGTMRLYSAGIGVGVGAGQSTYGAGVGLDYTRTLNDWSGPYYDSWKGTGYESTLMKGWSLSPSVSASLANTVSVSAAYLNFRGNYRYTNNIAGNLYRNFDGSGTNVGFGIGSSGSVGGGMNVGGGVGVGVGFVTVNTEMSGSRTGYKGAASSSNSSVSLGGGVSAGFSAGDKDGTSGGVGESVSSHGFTSGTNEQPNWPGYAKSVGLPNLKTSRIISGLNDYYQRTKGKLKLGGSITFMGLFYVSASVGYDEEAVTDKKKSVLAVESDSVRGVKFEQIGATGYLSSHVEDSGVSNISDFVRDNERPFNYDVNSNLPVPVLAPDMFMASAMGDAYTFKAYKYQTEISNEATNYIKGDVKIKGVLENDKKDVYTNGNINTNTSTSKWTGVTNLMGRTVSGAADPNFKKFDLGVPIEQYYFKTIDEIEVFDQDYYDNFGGINQPSKYVLTDDMPNYNAKGTYTVPTSSVSKSISNPSIKNYRINRNRLITQKNAKLAETIAYQSSIEDYAPYDISLDDGVTSKTTIDRTANYKENHINEFEVVNENGSKYVYGIPVINHTSVECLFNVESIDINKYEGLVKYGAGDNSVNNSNGETHFYNRKVIPEYATDFLLTNILSDDYEDLTGNGPSDDDLGQFVKFNYSKVHSNYKWRAPLCYRADTNATTYDYTNGAYFIEGLRSQTKDNMAQFSYGEKEVWYLHSIETKDQIVEFYLSERHDALGVTSENGTLNSSNRLQKLSKIQVFNKYDRLKNKAEARPIRTIDFEYDYSLCNNHPSNDGKAEVINSVNINENNGKLTLKSVLISDGESEEGTASPYTFHYNNNQEFDFQSSDRWGNYKANNKAVSNNLFPYSIQDSLSANVWAGTWKLDSMELPGGSSMKITYESDQYGYVQDKMAMRMFKIIGTDGAALHTANAPLYEKSNKNVGAVYNKLFIELDEPIEAPSASVAKTIFQESYLGKKLNDDNEFIYVKSLVDFGGGVKEPVEAFVQIKDFGLNAGVSGVYSVGWIEVKTMKDMLQDVMKNQQITGFSKSGLSPRLMPAYGGLSPICHFAWQYARNNLFDHMYLTATSIGEDVKALNAGMVYRSMAKKIDISESWIRLYDPNQEKYGGGHRVKNIRFYDGWDNMVANRTRAVYGKEYEYKKTNAFKSCSGVGAFEPTHGRDENPFFNIIWEPWETINFANVDEESPVNKLGLEKFVFLLNYDTSPYGGAYYPSSVVGYSRVKETDLTYENVTQSTTGSNHYGFYTSKDFPTKFISTGISGIAPKSINNRRHIGLGNFGVANAYQTTNGYISGASQGFLIENNNMHGSPRVIVQVDKNGGLVMNTTYKYLTNMEGDKLENKVKLIKDNGDIVEEDFGIRATFFSDFYISDSKTNGSIVATSYMRYGNLSKILRIFGARKAKQPKKRKGKPHTEKIRTYNSAALATMVKEVNRRGILYMVDQRAQNTFTRTTTHAWDYETGKPLVTSTNNEFNDSVYSFSYPSHWTNTYLQKASENIGRKFTVTMGSAGACTITSGGSADIFTKGDEVIFYPSGTNPTQTQLWVKEILPAKVTLIDRNGVNHSLTGSGYVQIVRSGNTNQASIPLGSITCLTNPVKQGNSNISFSKIIGANAVLVDDQRGVYNDSAFIDAVLLGEECNATYYLDDTCTTGQVNPFVTNLKGEYSVYKSYQYRTPRKEQLTSTTPSLADDGTYNSFTSFWEYDAVSKQFVNIFSTAHPSYSATGENWRIASDATIIDNEGRVLEQKNILDQYSSVLYGYNNRQNPRVPVAQTTNSRYKDMAAETFEGWDYYDTTNTGCNRNWHYTFQDLFVDQRTSMVAHTGDYSMFTCPQSESYITSLVDSSFYRISADRDTIIDSQEKIPGFAPGSGRYYLSVWTSQATGDLSQGAIDTLLDYDLDTSASIAIEYLNVSSVSISIDTIYPVGYKVEGWQKIEGDFTIPPAAAKIRVRFYNHSTDKTVFYDDFRIHPFNASMRVNVYDNNDLRLKAVLDENNYASFVEYDKAGRQIRVKKETVKGIRTLSENRTFQFKK